MLILNIYITPNIKYTIISIVESACFILCGNGFKINHLIKMKLLLLFMTMFINSNLASYPVYRQKQSLGCVDNTLLSNTFDVWPLNVIIVFHELVNYKGTTLEWGTNGFNYGSTPISSHCPITYNSLKKYSDAPLHQAIEFGELYRQKEGPYNIGSNNCQEFAENMYTFLGIPDWSESAGVNQAAVYFGIQKRPPRTMYGVHVGSIYANKVKGHNNLIYYNGTIMFWDEDDNTIYYGTTPKYAYPTKWNLMPSIIGTIKLDQIKAYASKYTQQYGHFEDSTLFANKLGNFIAYPNMALDIYDPSSNNNEYYRIGIQYHHCLYDTTEGKNYRWPLINFRGLIYQWDEEGFYISTKSRRPECPIYYDHQLSSLRDYFGRTYGYSRCSMTQANMFGQMNGFFKGQYSSSNSGHKFLKSMIRFLETDCTYQDLNFGCSYCPDPSGQCPLSNLRAFETTYKAYKGSRGWVFNTCSTYKNYFNQFVNDGYCNLIDLDYVDADIDVEKEENKETSELAQQLGFTPSIKYITDNSTRYFLVKCNDTSIDDNIWILYNNTLYTSLNVSQPNCTFVREPHAVSTSTCTHDDLTTMIYQTDNSTITLHTILTYLDNDCQTNNDGYIDTNWWIDHNRG